MTDQRWEAFLRWEEASRDTIDVKRCYIDVAGNLVAGILLSQIIFWFLPSKKGLKLRVKRDGREWLAKAREDWWSECRITTKRFDRAIGILRNKGLVVTRRFRFAGSPMVHIGLNTEALLDHLECVLGKGENGILPKGKNHLPETSGTSTETNTENTDRERHTSNVTHFWETNFGTLTAPVGNRLQSLVNAYSEAWVLQAMQRAADRGKRSIRYIETILENWAAGDGSPERPGRPTTFRMQKYVD